MKLEKIRKDLPIGTCEEVKCSIPEFKALLDEHLAEIGATDETGHIFIEYESGWRDEGGSITAYVWRWETKAEASKREASEKARAELSRAEHDARREALDRAAYAALKAKYG